MPYMEQNKNKCQEQRFIDIEIRGLYVDRHDSYKGGLHERIKSKTGRGIHSYCHVTG